MSFLSWRIFRDFWGFLPGKKKVQQGQASDAADFSFYRKSFEGKFRRCSRASCRSISQLGQVVDEDFFLHRRPLGFIGVFFSSPLVQAGFFFASSLLRLALLSSFVRASFLAFLTLRSRFVPGIVVASLARRMGAAVLHRHTVGLYHDSCYTFSPLVVKEISRWCLLWFRHPGRHFCIFSAFARSSFLDALGDFSRLRGGGSTRKQLSATTSQVPV